MIRRGVRQGHGGIILRNVEDTEGLKDGDKKVNNVRYAYDSFNQKTALQIY